jgi:hypothetical protein
VATLHRHRQHSSASPRTLPRVHNGGHTPPPPPAPACVNTCQPASTYVSLRHVCQPASRVSACVNICQPVSMCVSPCQQTQASVKPCRPMSACVSPCQQTQASVKPCQPVSAHVSKHKPVSTYVSKHKPVSTRPEFRLAVQVHTSVSVAICYCFLQSDELTWGPWQDREGLDLSQENLVMSDRGSGRRARLNNPCMDCV